METIQRTDSCTQIDNMLKNAETDMGTAEMQWSSQVARA